MEPLIINLVGLLDAEAALFAEAGITDRTTIASLDLPAFTQVLGDQVGMLAKRYKLKRVAEYLSSGKEIGPDTTMGDINLVLSSNHQNVGANAPNPAARLDPRHGTMKASINTISKFSGDLEDFEDWSTKTAAALGITVYCKLLDGPLEVGNDFDAARNNELYHMFVIALVDGAAMHIMEDVKDQNGYAAWMAIKEWYGMSDTGRTIIGKYRSKLDALLLDDATPAGTFVNHFRRFSQKLEENGEGYTADMRKQVLMKDSMMSAKKARCFKSSEGGKSNGGGPSSGKIPSIPNSILNLVKPASARKNLIKWRGVWNSEGRILQLDELASTEYDGKGKTPSKREHNNDSSDESVKTRNTQGKEGSSSKKGKSGKGRRITGVVRRTETKTFGTPDSSIRISMKDPDDHVEGDEYDDIEIEFDQEEDSTAPVKKERAKKQKNPSKRKHKRAKSRRSPISRRGRVGNEKPRAILDPGTECDIVGGDVWTVLEKVIGVEAQLGGALAGMGKCSLPLVNAVAAYNHSKEGTILIGAGDVGYDEQSTQTELLFNTHKLRKHGVIVSDTTIRDGGLQSIEVDGISIALDFVDEKTLSFYLRKPTEKELENLEIHWFSP